MSPIIKIAIVGNGFGGINALKNLHKIFHGDQRIELILIGQKNYFLFTPLLHEVATGGINPFHITEPIRKIAECCLDKFYLGKAESINLKNRTIKLEEITLSYDYLILSPGAETNFYNIPGGREYSFPLKSIDDATKIKNHIIAQMEKASRAQNKNERKKILKFVIVGGGPTGVELVAELEELIKKSFSHYYSKEVMEDVSIMLVQKGEEVVPQFGKKIRQKSLEVLQKKGIDVKLRSTVKEIGQGYLILNEKTKIHTETIIWVAGVKPNEIRFEQEVAKAPDQRLVVNEYLQLEKHPEVFAIGDAASFKQNGVPLPALAQVAVKESSIATQNIKLLIENREPKKFVYHSSGNLLSLGQWMGSGEIRGFTFSGRLTWWIWRTVYLSKLVSFKKKVRVAIDWTINLFSSRDISQL